MALTGESDTRVFQRLYADAKRPDDLPWDHSEPTTFLQEIVAVSPPGRALDLGCGTGADAVFLASRGWEVMALDFMPQAVNITRHRAASAKVKVDVQRTDITIWSGAGRFDLITAVLCAVMVRLEASELRAESALLAELFVEDMDAQLREFGVNDAVVGKRVGKLMSVLGGRLGAYRGALAERDREKLIAAIARNVTFSQGSDEEAGANGVADRLLELAKRLDTYDDKALLKAEAIA